MFNYVKLRDGAEPEFVVENFDRFYDKYMSDMGELLGATFHIELERLDRIHLFSLGKALRDFMYCDQELGFTGAVLSEAMLDVS